MATLFRITVLFVFLVLIASCGGEAEQAADRAPPAAAALDDEPILRFDTTGQAVSVTHVPTGRTHVLFEDETVEASEEGTFHQLLSSAGPYVSYSMEWYYEGGAHPSYGKTYSAVVVGETVDEADLRDLFSEDALYTAMQQTELVQETPLEHTSLDELLEGLAEAYPCTMSFDGFFSSFFVKEVSGGTAEVVVGLTHGCEVERGTFTTLTLRMDIAEDQRTVFEDLRLFNTQD